MKICALSDPHGQLQNITIEPVDILFICGDIVPLNIQRDIPVSIEWFKEEFIKWCNEQPVDQMFMVAGNHDFFLERTLVSEIKEMLIGTKITILYNESGSYIDKDGHIYTIWGSPLCHIFGNWAFMKSPEYELEQFEKIPDNLDFLITHDAAYGRSDVVLDKSVWWADGSHIGNPELAEVLKTKHPKYHFFGHLHSCNHSLIDFEGTQTACVSLLDEKYRLVYEPLYLEINE